MKPENKKTIAKWSGKTLALLALVTVVLIGGGFILLKKAKNNRPVNQYGSNVYAVVMSRHDDDAHTSVRKTYADIEYEFKHQVYNESVEDNSQRFAVGDTLIVNITPAETIIAGTRKDGEDLLGSETADGKLF